VSGPPQRVLVCDDESQILRALKIVLRDAGFEPVATATGGEALDAAAVRPPVAAIIDLVLPDISGIEVCRRLRVARLRAVLRRATSHAEEPTVRVDGLEIDLAARIVRRDGEEVHLTPIEHDLLRTLVRNRGRLMTHRALLTEVWGPQYADATDVLRTHIANLRRKLEPDDGPPRYIRTDPGVGYRFVAQ
jgi:two-component system KDP operon response regulator KdpE